jgi:hypothetical protein
MVGGHAMGGQGDVGNNQAGQGQERRTMTAAQPESLGTEGVRSLEVRWLFPGQLVAAVAGWFGRFPAETTVVEDAYLLNPHLPGLSVKVRAGRALEVKMYRGSPGLLEVAGRARGRLEFWQKWSFPHGPLSRHSTDSAGWRQVSKRRRISWFSLAGGHAKVGAPGLGVKPGCAVELTEARSRGEAWWTLGFEATGPANMLRRGLEAAAAQVFSETFPAGVELGLDGSMSYAQWLRSRPDAGRDAATDNDLCQCLSWTPIRRQERPFPHNERMDAKLGHFAKKEHFAKGRDAALT